MENTAPRKYVIVDVETSGGHPFETRITEISIQVSNGKDLIASYTTLINPQVKIPPYVRRLTGITNEMTSSAPKFRMVAKEIFKFVNEATFVAHNVAFDYNVLKSEFKRIGIDWEAERLCTVKASRKIFPGKESYSLGKLSADLSIIVENRHRAEGDARATLELFHMLMTTNVEMLHESISTEKTDYLLYEKYSHLKLHTVPNKTGLLEIVDKTGKSKFYKSGTNLKKIAVAYIKQAEKENKVDLIGEIKFTLTGSPLLAKILERERRGKHREPQPTDKPGNKKLSERSYIIIDKGPDANHKSVLLILEGKLVNYGIAKTEATQGDVKAIIPELSKAKNPENIDVVQFYLSSNKVEKLEFIKG
ncbi:MAG TPA: 3'-5' exonuclease [Flavobacteriales bacterium]|nr:3'-5' exonuclease [Flavobacteriales bacterium]